MFRCTNRRCKLLSLNLQIGDAVCQILEPRLKENCSNLGYLISTLGIRLRTVSIDTRALKDAKSSPEQIEPFAKNID